MQTGGDNKSKRMEREQGDINTTANRKKYWERNLSGRAREIFEQDNKYFLHQSLSTPVLNVLSKAQGDPISKTLTETDISTCMETVSTMQVSIILKSSRQ